MPAERLEGKPHGSRSYQRPSFPSFPLSSGVFALSDSLEVRVEGPSGRQRTQGTLRTRAKRQQPTRVEGNGGTTRLGWITETPAWGLGLEGRPERLAGGPTSTLHTGFPLERGRRTAKALSSSRWPLMSMLSPQLLG